MKKNVMPFLWLRQETEEEIRKEIEGIEACGVKTFCVESRPFYPERIVEEGKPPCDYNTDAWFQRLRFILQLAKEKDMQVWVLDEKGFPTGICNDKLSERRDLIPKQLYACSVDFVSLGEQLCMMTSVGRCKTDVLVGAYIFKRKKGAILFDDCIEIPVQKNTEMVDFMIPKGEYRIVFLTETNRFGEFEFYIDMLRKESVDFFVEEIYQKHYDNLKEYFGDTFVGFFSDEPRLGNDYHNAKICGYPDEFSCTLGMIGGAYPICDEVYAYMCKQGYDKKQFLALFMECGDFTSGFRCLYGECITDLYQKNFVQNISDWCHQHHVEYAGHIIEDMGSHCRFGWSPGHYFKSMDGADYAGIDVVLHSIKPYINEGEYLSPVGKCSAAFYKHTLARLASSSAALDKEKKGAICEIFGAYGFGETIKQMLYLVNHMVVMGINYFIPHGFSMDFPDVDCPPHFYAGGKIPSYLGYRKLFDYMQKIGGLLSGGERLTTVAVLYHGEAEWSGKPYESMDEIAKILNENQIDFDFVPHYKLKNCAGKYKVLIVPKAKFYPQYVLENIQNCSLEKIYIGRDCKRNQLPRLLYEKGMTAKFVKNRAKDLKILQYHKGGSQYLFLFNEGLEKVQNVLYLPGNWKCVDLLNEQEYGIENKNDEYAFVLDHGEARLLMTGTAPLEEPYMKVGEITQFAEEEKTYDQDEFVPHTAYRKEFSGYMRYTCMVDLTEIHRLCVDYDGEYCCVCVGDKEYFSIDKACFDIHEAGKKKIQITVCNTLANALQDRFSAYAGISTCRVKKLTLWKREV